MKERASRDIFRVNSLISLAPRNTISLEVTLAAAMFEL